MKKKFSKILGIGLTLALLCSLLLTAAPVSALTQPVVTAATAADAVISTANADWNIRFELAKQLTDGTTVTVGVLGAYNLAGIGDSFVITATAANNVATLTPTNGTVTGTMSGAGNFSGGTTATFATIGETCTVTVLTVNGTGVCSGTWTWAGTTAPTAAVGVGAADTITIVFPSDTAVLVGCTATILAGPGWINGIWLPATTTTLTSVVGTVLTRTVVITLPATTRIGEGAEVRLSFTGGITNPSTPAAYNLTLKTSKETTAVTSAAYTITAPTLAATPGTVRWYNAALVPMGINSGATPITVALADIATKVGVGWTIEVEPGAYTEAVTIPVANTTLTIKATGTAAETVIVGNVTINAASATVDGFTIAGNATIGTAGDKATFQNCTFIKTGTGLTAETLITYNNQVALGTGTITGNTIDTSLGAVVDNGILVNEPGLTISNNTFTVDGAAGAEDSAINTVAAGTTTISGNTISGASGIGVTVGIADKTAVTGNTFSNLNSALNITGVTASTLTFTLNTAGVVTATAGTAGATFTYTALPTNATCAAGISPVTLLANASTTFTATGTVAAGTSTITVTSGSLGLVLTSGTIGISQAAIATGKVTVTSNTIDVCGILKTTTVAGQAAIHVNTTGSLAITNNTIINSPDDIIEVDANADQVNVMFNNLTGNTLGVDNDDAVDTVNATHNWWGAATGAATGMNAGLVDATGYLGIDATGTFSLATATVTAATTQNVDVSIATTAGAASAAGIIGVANYASNPGAATPYPAISGGFFDVYIGTPASTTDVATIKLYGAVTADTVAYVYSALQGTWTTCDSQGVNTTTGYVWVKTGALINPAITDLVGTAFALVEAPAAGALGAPVITVPASGAADVSLTPIFAWGAVPDADGYYFQMADNASFVIPMVKLDEEQSRLIVTAYAYVGELPYSKAYYWRVKAVSGSWIPVFEKGYDVGHFAVESDWASSVFITKAEPVEPIPPVVIEPAPPAPVITITQPDIVVPLPAETPITPGWIYAIIAVGAVLVIALLVLIVRTRRVA